MSLATVKQKKIRNIFKNLFVLKEPNSILLSKEHTSKIMKTYSSTGKKVKVFWDFFLHIFSLKVRIKQFEGFCCNNKKKHLRICRILIRVQGYRCEVEVVVDVVATNPL